MNQEIIYDEAYFIGRKEHLNYFRRLLESKQGKKLLNIYGTGGVGKSTLMDYFKKYASEQESVRFISLESRDFLHQKSEFCLWLLSQLNPGEEIQSEIDLVKKCMVEIEQQTKHGTIVIAIDTYEELGSMDSWLREQFLPKLPESVIILISGRNPLKGQWALSSYWRQRIHYIPLQHFSQQEVQEYLNRHSILDSNEIEDIWKKSKGHPFTLSLLTFCHMHEEMEEIIDQSELYQQLAAIWLKEIDDEQLCRMVEAAAILRHFHLENMSYLLEEEVSAAQFKKLTELSFIRKAGRGWVLHDIMKEATLGLLKEQTPSRYAKLVKRCVHYYYRYIVKAPSTADLTWEVGELLYYTGSSRMRALYHQQSQSEYYWEPLTAANLSIGEKYLQDRLKNEKDRELVGKDPETGKVFRWQMSKEESLYAIKDLDLQVLTGLNQDIVKVLVSPENGSVLGIAAIIPINCATLSYLEEDPFLGPYFSSIPKNLRKQYEVPPYEQAGWAIRSLDVADPDNEFIRLEALNMLFQYMCSRKVFIASPPPFEMYTLHLDLGFEIVPNLIHTNYDGKTATPTYMLDTRGEKLEQFLQTTLERMGYYIEKEATSTVVNKPLPALTNRENEIASLVYEGKTNPEIAEVLFVSEITVKKHISAIYSKLGIRNRNELIRLLGAK
jgi:DNA-binding CsgD family transcriptional regulator